MSDKKVGVGFGVMMMKDNKVLLGQRHVDPDKADSELSGEGTWTMPGGKLEYGESFEEGAKREVAEGTGIEPRSVEIACVNNDLTDQVHFVTIGMYSENFEGEPQVMEPDEITQWKWFALDSLPSPLFFPSEKVLKNYHAKRFYIPESEA